MFVCADDGDPYGRPERVSFGFCVPAPALLNPERTARLSL
jgi:hypothetical protein